MRTKIKRALSVILVAAMIFGSVMSGKLINIDWLSADAAENRKTQTAEDLWLWPVNGVNKISKSYEDGHKAIVIAPTDKSSVSASKSGRVVYVFDGCNLWAKKGITSCKDEGICSPTINGEAFSLGNMCNYGLGRAVVIEHGDSTFSVYAHLSEINAEYGQYVNQGDVIGVTGAYGNATEDGLYFVTSKGHWKNPFNNNPVNFGFSQGITYFFSTEIDIDLRDVNHISNTSVVIGADFGYETPVQEVGYIISNDKAKVEADMTLPQNRVDSRISDFASNKCDETKRECSFSVQGIAGRRLIPTTDYYYKIVIKSNGKWYQSPVGIFRTTAEIPSETTLNISQQNRNIGIGDISSISWNESKNADSYTVSLFKGSKNVFTREGIEGTVMVFPSSCFNEAGIYDVVLTAENGAGSVEMSDSVSITVHENVCVAFVDSISGKTIVEQSVVYGHSATEPVSPSQDGYTFVGWDKTFDNVTEDLTVSTVYEANNHTVNFVNGITGQIYKTETVIHNGFATPPVIEHYDGYEFVRWNKDFNNIKEDTTVSAVFSCYDSYPLYVKLDNDNDGFADAVRDDIANGYELTVKLSNSADEEIAGKLIAVLKTETGYQFAQEETDFVVSSNSNKTISIFIGSDMLAYCAEIYTVDINEPLCVLSQPMSGLVDNSGEWSDWIQYEGDVPVTEGENNITHVETRVTTSPTLYRYRLMETTTSYSTSLSGWTQNGYSKETAGTGTYYYASYPGGFDKSHELYNKYSKSKATNTETSTSIRQYSSPSHHTYIYWHWTYRLAEACKPYNRIINVQKGNYAGYYHDQFAAFESSVSYGKTDSIGTTANEYFCNRNNYTDISWWWFRFNVYKQTYTDYRKVYNYYRWAEWSEWSETAPVIPDGAEYDLEVSEGKAIYEYRYKTEDLVPGDVDVSQEQIKSVNANLNRFFAGKRAVLFVYKQDDFSLENCECIGYSFVGDDGSVIFDNMKLVEAPSVETGDFKAVVHVEGCSEPIDICIFEAPEPQYTVTFYNYNNDGTTLDIIYQTFALRGETVEPPTSETLDIPEGYEFVRWNQSTVNINGNHNVFPEVETKDYIVAFVDSLNQNIIISEAKYGEDIFSPDLAGVGEKNISWDMSDAEMKEEISSDGWIIRDYIVARNTVIYAQYYDKSHSVGFIVPQNSLEETETVKNKFMKGEPLDEWEILYITVPHGYHVDTPFETEISQKYVFKGWKNVDTGYYLSDTTVTDSATYYPVYEYAYATQTPIASVPSGEYDSVQTVTLSCSTENAAILYTTDGTDPLTSATAQVYSSPIEIVESGILTFCASAPQMKESVTVTECYAINNTANKHYVYTVLTNLHDGIYYRTLVPENTNFTQFRESGADIVEGADFCGLYLNEDFTDEYDAESEIVNCSRTLYAYFELQSFCVSFNDYNGEHIADVTASYMLGATPPALSEREGFVFTGWDTNEYFCVTRDLTVAAVYVPAQDYSTVSLSRSRHTMMSGNSYRFNATVSNAASHSYIIWCSSDEDIIRVDSKGNATAVGKGSAEIYATLADNGETAKCSVTVIGNPSDEITLNASSHLTVENGILKGIRIDSDITNGIFRSETVQAIKKQFHNSNLIFVDIKGKELNDTDCVGTGTVIMLYENSKVKDEITVVVSGDMDGDGTISNRDSSRTARYLVDKESPNEIQLMAMDVNFDGYINNRDAAKLSRFLVGKEVFM